MRWLRMRGGQPESRAARASESPPTRPSVALAAGAATLSSVLQQAQATEEQLRRLRRSTHTLQAALGGARQVTTKIPLSTSAESRAKPGDGDHGVASSAASAGPAANTADSSHRHRAVTAVSPPLAAAHVMYGTPRRQGVGSVDARVTGARSTHATPAAAPRSARRAEIMRPADNDDTLPREHRGGRRRRSVRRLVRNLDAVVAANRSKRTQRLQRDSESDAGSGSAM